ncbi:hypothetical protein DVH24_021425 [Malus domestica]|uniref:RNase H type-1 domain-containing protein n=1 Tax=Malus domestica TaxID=3750 RepID=A0A498K028_MALDO|nr:hypothetical protein DVH24_021425 [Malus domestica]
MAEAEAVWAALLACVDMEFDVVQIESDSKCLVDMINDKVQPNVVTEALFLYIQYVKQQLGKRKEYVNTNNTKQNI